MSYKVEYYLDGKYINTCYFDKNELVKESIKDWFKIWAKNEREAIIYYWNNKQEKYYEIDRQNFIYALQSFYCNKCKAPGFYDYNSPPYPNKCCCCNS
jgi:hypothetical protein